MRNRKTNQQQITRFDVDTKGLSKNQVESRINQGLVNKTKVVYGKSYPEIIFSDVFSFFNILLFIIAGFMIWAEHYSGLFFLVVIIPNMLIGLYEDLKSRHLMAKLHLLTQPKVVAIRDGEKINISTKEIVLDDVIYLSSESQICADSIILDGNLLVNESMLTGESDNVHKTKGDYLYSGSFVVSGNAYTKVDKVGKDCYVEQINQKANKFKRSPSQILRSLKQLFLVIGIIVIVLGLSTISLYISQGGFSSIANSKESIAHIAGSMVGMIPSGLYLLTSTTLAVAVIALARKKTQVQDFYSVEMLARTNVLCVDKTGTITDGTMNVTDVINLSNLDLDSIKQIVSNILIATNDNNLTAKGLKKYFNFELTKDVVTALPFNSDNKYSGVTFKGKETYVIGAPEFLNITNKTSILKRIEKYTALGNRVMVLASSDSPITNNKVNGVLTPLAIIILQDHIRDDAKEIFKWFNENNVQIKVISGDNAATVSEIARQAGVNNAEKFISLENKSDEEVRLLAKEYTVFGRVTPEQKEIIVQSLKDDKKVVAMTGDGVNDILALKRADCSIAMASGADASRNISHIVLLDSNFARLPEIVAEGRRVVNNLQRTCSLFLVKTGFTMFFTICFLLGSLFTKDASIRYPFETNNMYIWEIFGIGLSAFFLALEPNAEIIKGKFLTNVFKKALPAAIMMITAVGSIYIGYLLQANNVMYTGITSIEIATSMSVVTFSILCLLVLFKVCSPLNKYRRIIFYTATGISLLLIGFSALITYGFHKEEIILKLGLGYLNPINYLVIGIVVVVVASFYIFINYIVEVLKGEHLNDKN